MEKKELPTVYLVKRYKDIHFKVANNFPKELKASLSYCFTFQVLILHMIISFDSSKIKSLYFWKQKALVVIKPLNFTFVIYKVEKLILGVNLLLVYCAYASVRQVVVHTGCTL